MEVKQTWQIRLFDTLEIESPSGVVTAFAGTKAGGILAYLALHLGSPVKREELANVFWADSDSDKQRTRLRQEILTLRTLFGADETSPFQSSPQSARLSADFVITDVAQFLGLLDEAKKSSTPAEREHALSEAVTLYRGDLLMSYPDIALSERVSFAQSFEVALRELAALRQSQGDFGGAEESLQRLLSYNSLLEEAHVDLMRLYASSGQPTKLRRQYAALQEILRKEMNSSPTDATRQLVEELLRNTPVQPSLSAPAVAVPILPPVTTTPEAERETFWTEVAQQESLPPFPPTTQKPARPLWAVGLVCLLLVVIALPFVNRRNHPSPASQIAAQPPLQYDKEKWKFIYTPQSGETGDAEPKAMATHRNYGWIYVTGLVQTDKEDIDILTLRLSTDGKLLDHARYSSPEHDCDRAYAIAQETKQEGTVAVYVAGETYIPSGYGTPEGWRLVLIKYDGNLSKKWVRRSPGFVHNELHNIRVAYSEDGGITVGGTALENGVHKILLLRYNSQGDLSWQRTFNPSGSHTEWVTLCYDRVGKQIWMQYNQGTGRGADIASHITLSKRDSFVCVSGVFYNADTATGGVEVNLALAQYGLDGTPHWTRSDIQSGPEISLLSLARNSYPSVITMAGTKPTPERNSAIFLSQYDNAGNLRWNTQYVPPPGFKSALDPYLVTMDQAEVIVLCSLSDQPAIWAHQNNQFLLLRYSIEGVLRSQYSFKMKKSINRPSSIFFSYKDGSILVCGQAQQENKKLALVALRY
ncbi:MAG: BTAD domain-containing putative transcriptional regulator [Armatimonadetes bacterium]|nr:BTAD domain-containing putative transcriptional regulator [Armatimonadota bacterium]